MQPTISTHETYLHAVRDAVIRDALERQTITTAEADKLRHVKMVYGVGHGARGVTIRDAWKGGDGASVDMVEIAALVEESYVQLAGTTIHELAHVLAGVGEGHSRVWKDAAVRLGFVKRPEAAGQRYCLALIRPTLRHAVYRLAAEIGDGTPGFADLLASGAVAPAALGTTAMGAVTGPRPCKAGQGTQGGKAQGRGSGSRLRLWECECVPPVKVRTARDDFRAHCDDCESAFKRP